jgi:hypothetical protein
MALPRRTTAFTRRQTGLQGALDRTGAGTSGSGRYTLLWPLAGAALAVLAALAWLGTR